MWKKATVITIPKPGKVPKTPSGHRPIALLSSLSKVFERIILVELQKSTMHKIRPEQHAFRHGHSTTLQLVNLVDRLNRNRNNKLHTAAVFIDIEKVFDRVWHDGLIYKMTELNIPINLIQMVHSFLSNLTFAIKTEGHMSTI
jgi:hypothetical protein